ncbi:MAG: ABC transporter ATP-binding protein [Aminivibrio sp.]|jgi:iron complex transport system ATP-binding protein|nr:ABC transporter ATP-binding protein [Aminivibrio sp.]
MILSVNGISFAYRGVPVLEDVTFSLAEGEMAALLGPNGTGKTTLLRAINGILRPAGGTVLMESRDALACPPRERAKFFAYVPQRGEPVRLTVFDAVLLGRRPHLGWSVERRDLEKVESALKNLSLDRFALRYLDELSGGEFQKVLLARALVQEPRVLLLDEPTSSLDLKNQLDMLATLRKVVKGHGVAALLSLHDLNTAFRYADRLLFLKDGCIRGMFLPSEVPGEIVAEVYGVPVDIVLHKGVPLVVPS